MAEDPKLVRLDVRLDVNEEEAVVVGAATALKSPSSDRCERSRELRNPPSDPAVNVGDPIRSALAVAACSL